MFKMENFNEGETVYQPNICQGAKNSPKTVDSYKDYDIQAECNSEEYLRLNKRFSKIFRILDKRYENNVTINVKNIYTYI